MTTDLSEELLLEVDHVKYRKAGEGRSPIGRIFIYKNFVEWKDNTSPDKLQVKFAIIKGQRVSPPNKDKVQLQLVLQNDDQATFVFLDPTKNKEQRMEQRDMLKETLQQALLTHRSLVNQLVASQEKGSKTVELEAKRKILLENEQLNALFHHLVVSKLITNTEFWGDHFNAEGALAEVAGVNGAFLSNIAQQEGTNGIKLNLNAEIIRTIFNTYPAVERKHLELVPHELTEQQFWSKFFQSHYYHREREVLPNPADPFAECVKLDDTEIENIIKAGVDRKRFDLNSLDDNTLAEYNPKTDGARSNSKTTLVRRCNYLSERIVSFLKSIHGADEPATSKDPTKGGFAVLNRIINEEEDRLESAELVSQENTEEQSKVQIGAAEIVSSKKYSEAEGRIYKRKVIDFLNEYTEEDSFLLNEDWLFQDESMNGYSNDNHNSEKNDSTDWDLTPKELGEVRNIHEAVATLLKHFWLCFPVVTPDLEAKLERIYESLIKYKEEQLKDGSKKMRCIFSGASGLSRICTRSFSISSRKWSEARPAIDFDYLLDKNNLELIRKNITSRKGVGDIDALHAKWEALQSIINSTEPPQITEADLKRHWDELYGLALLIPNTSHSDVPIGNEENAKKLAEFGQKREGQLLTAEKLVQSWRSLLHPNEACGQRSYTFLGALANLEKALIDYVFERVCVLGFKPVTVPDIVPISVTEACGVVRDGNRHLQYLLDDEPDVSLSGTAEMGIANLIKGRTFETEQLPVRCFRNEISKSATEAKLYRVHEFFKVEMFTVCDAESSYAELDHITQIQKGTFESLGLHCRILEMPSEELGAAASKKVDIEAWMPGRDVYGEVSSASNCTDYQSRRLGIRYRNNEGKSLFAHSCNGTAVASTRTLIALLETFQNDKKGLLDLPDVIRNRLKTQRPSPLRFKSAPALS